MSVRLRPEIANSPAYRQGKAAGPQSFKLSSNENPFDPLPSVVEAYKSADHFNRYPDTTALGLRSAIADTYGVAIEQVAVGAGSIAVLQNLMGCVASRGDEIVYPWRSFEGYPSTVRAIGATAVEIPLTATFDHDLAAMLAAITPSTRAILLCTPNNPTGNALSHVDVQQFIERVPDDVLVIIDEAYVEFTDGDLDSLALVNAHDNVVALRTFSKAYGLAGLRVGYVVAAPAIVDALAVETTAFTVSAGAQAAAVASLGALAELDERVAALRSRRAQVVTGLQAQGWKIPEAHGNFVWLPLGEATTEAEAIFIEHGLIVRAFAGEGIRISIGEDESIEPLLKAAKIVVTKTDEIAG